MKRTIRVGSILQYWRISVMTVLAGGVLAAILVFQLGSLVGGLSSQEAATRDMISGNALAIESIFRGAILLPYQLGLFILQLLPFHGAGSLRFISVIFGLIGLAAFYYLTHKWYGPKTAVLATALLSTSDWFLHTARYGSPEAVYLCGVVLCAIWASLQSPRLNRTNMLLFAFTLTIALYTPGVAAVLFGALVWQRQRIIAFMKRSPQSIRIGAAIVAVIGTLPLLLSIIVPADGYTRISFVRMLLGIPSSIPNPVEYLQSVRAVLQNIFIYSDGNPVWFVGNLPFLDIITTTLFVAGAAGLYRYRKLDRTKVIAGAVAYGVLISALGVVPVSILLPFIYLVAAAGIQLLLREWFSVFPRNPVARSVGFGLLSLCIAVSMTYSLARCFIAWPKTDSTAQAFRQKP